MRPPGEHPAGLDPLYALGAGAFGVVAQARGWAYDRRLLPITRVDRPVISVGNLMVGGTGKTPVVLALLEQLGGRRVAVLSRGYGRRSRVAPVVVSAGQGPLVSAEEGGDEPCLIAARSRAMVVVDPDRIRGARRAIALGAEVLLLDDGFQHRRLHRDLDLVVVDPAAPFGNGHLLPRGPLREPPSALDRADLILGVGAGQALQNDDRWVEFQLVPTTIGPHPAAWLSGRRVGAFAAIARPERFLQTLVNLGAQVVDRLLLPDHTFVEPGRLQAFVTQAMAAGAEVVVTTEKDAARGVLPQGVLPLQIHLQLGAGAARLQAALAQCVGGQR